MRVEHQPVTPPKTNMTIGKSHFLIGDTSSNAFFASIVMLIFGVGGLCFYHVYIGTPEHPANLPNLGGFFSHAF